MPQPTHHQEDLESCRQQFFSGGRPAKSYAPLWTRAGAALRGDLGNGQGVVAVRLCNLQAAAAAA